MDNVVADAPIQEDPIALLKLEIVDIKGRLDASTLKDQADDDKFNSLSKCVTSTENGIVNLSLEMTEVFNKLSSIKTSLFQYQTASQHNSDIVSLNSLITKLSDEIDEHSFSLDDLNKSISENNNKLRASIDEINAELEDQNEFHLKKQDDIDSIRKILFTLQRVVDAQEKVIQQLGQQITFSSSSIGDVSTSLANHKQECQASNFSLSAKLDGVLNHQQAQFANLASSTVKKVDDVLAKVSSIPWVDDLTSLKSQMNESFQQHDTIKLKSDFYDKFIDTATRKLDRLETMVKSLQLK